MKKLFSSLPFRLLLGVILGIAAKPQNMFKLSYFSV